MSMIERVARAIYESWENFPTASDRAWDAYAEKLPRGADQFRKHAIAAIEAMREPTQAMIEAGAVGSGEDSEAVAEGAWEYMIDAALKSDATGDMR